MGENGGVRERKRCLMEIGNEMDGGDWREREREYKSSTGMC